MRAAWCCAAGHAARAGAGPEAVASPRHPAARSPAQVNLCCGGGNQSDPTCNRTFIELARYITPFRRGLGRWLLDATHLLPLVAAPGGPQTCTFQASTDAWALGPWFVTLSLRFETSAAASPPPRAIVPLWQSGAWRRGVVTFALAVRPSSAAR